MSCAKILLVAQKKPRKNNVFFTFNFFPFCFSLKLRTNGKLYLVKLYARYLLLFKIQLGEF